MKLKIPRPGNRKVGLTRSWRWRAFNLAGTVGISLLAFALYSCRPSSSEPVTVTFLDPEWLHDSNTASGGLSGSLRQGRLISDEALEEFTRNTGIRVKHLPTPENPQDQLALTRDLLQKGAVTPDVYAIDVIWPGILSEYVIDLKPYFASELPSEHPELVANYTVQDKLVAMPYHSNIGVLFYRTDLLLKYGYREPPRTWDELERMAIRIQQGERAKGEKDFWGFVWPGAASEGLACNALEWQVSEGGGRVIEDNKKVSVNNSAAIRAWERAAHWVGWISPPSVISYQELDAGNIFWISGRAAFFRGWASNYFLSHPTDVPFRDEGGVTSVPGGKAARVDTLGGFGLAVSRWSAHRPEAIKLIEFLTRREAQIEAAGSHSLPERLELYELPTILAAYAGMDKPGGSVLLRPSGVTREKYGDVVQAYTLAVHSVLTGKSKAPDAAAALEKELVRITGFEAGHP